MNILFSASACGLGNNGGSKTIIRSAETLQSMGHNVVIWANVNRYNWHTPKVPILSSHDIVLRQEDVENYKEVVVSVWEIESCLRRDRKWNKNTVWWCRGWEKWVKGEQWLIEQSKRFVDAGGKIIVNSSWLIKQFKEKCGIDVELCFAGLDEWEDCFDWDDTEAPFVIGGLIYERHKTKNSELVRKYSNYTVNINNDHNDNSMNEIYGDCHIWLSTSVNEGFHNVPAEASMSGCYIVGVDCVGSGTSDYLTKETGGLYKTEDELIHELNNPDFSKVEKMQKVLKEKIGSRTKCMERFLELIG